MLDKLWEALTSVAILIIGVALVAVLVSKNANTAGVLQAYFSGNANLLGVAEAPVTGSQVNLDLSYPNSAAMGGAPSLNSDFGQGLTY